MSRRFRLISLAVLTVLMISLCEANSAAPRRKNNNKNNQVLQQKKQQPPQTPVDAALANLKAAQKQMEDKQFSLALQNVRGAITLISGMAQQDKSDDSSLDKALKFLKEGAGQLQYKKNEEATGSVANALDALQEAKGGNGKRPEPKKKDK